jgi:hypothetical protein
MITENRKLIKEFDVELTPYDFEGYSNFKDTNIKLYKDYIEISFIFDYAEESEEEDDILGRKIVRLSSSTHDVVCLDKNAIVEISYMKQMLPDPENDEVKYPVWSVVLSNLSGNIKIRCKNKSIVAEVKDILLDWKYNKGEFNE